MYRKFWVWWTSKTEGSWIYVGRNAAGSSHS